jgi:hypothetical protein
MMLVIVSYTQQKSTLTMMQFDITTLVDKDGTMLDHSSLQVGIGTHILLLLAADSRANTYNRLLFTDSGKRGMMKSTTFFFKYV